MSTFHQICKTICQFTYETALSEQFQAQTLRDAFVFIIFAQLSHMCGSKKTGETVNLSCRLALFIAAADRAAFLHDI